MANEIQMNSGLKATKNSVTVQTSPAVTFSKIQTMESTLDKEHHTVQAVGTSEEALSLGDVDNSNATGDEYMVQCINRDPTNYVEVLVKYAATPSYWVIGKMRPGEPWGPVRLPKLDGSSLGGIYLKANTASCDVEVVTFEAGDPAA
jgi:hypothetical protein